MRGTPYFKLAQTVLAGMAACTILAVTAHAQSADELLKKMKETYAAIKSYADTGVVLMYPDATSSNPVLRAQARSTFTTYFSRSPRRFFLDFHTPGGEFVVWGDTDAFHTWDKFTGARYDYPNPNNTGAMKGSVAITKIPTLLYGKAPLLSDFSYYDDVELDGTESIGGHICHRLVGRAHDEYAATGKQVNVRKMTVWIDSELFLVRQISQEWKTPGGGFSRQTVTYQAQANPMLDENKFKFTPPESK